MSYGIKNALRLTLRDYYFMVKSYLNNASSGNVYVCNSYPKSGTHLLAQVLMKLNNVTHWNDIISVQSLSGTMNTYNHIKWKYMSAPENSLVRSHLMYTEEMKKILSLRNHHSFFIYRDPRDVVCSHANWITKEPRIYLHDYYVSTLKDDESRIAASIQGKPIGTPFGSNLSQPNIKMDFERWRGWLHDGDTLSIKFEHLVGGRGGGNEEHRLNTIRSIIRHVGSDIPDNVINEMFSSASMDPRDSHTFRKGQKGSIGTWKNKFTDEHKDLFKHYAGDLLIELGYERDYDW